MTEWQPIETAPKWQPIETAPKDGTEVLLWARWDWDGTEGEKCPEEYGAQVAFFHDEEWEEKCWVAVSYNPYEDIAFAPTHWMPLPEPPK